MNPTELQAITDIELPNSFKQLCLASNVVTAEQAIEFANRLLRLLNNSNDIIDTQILQQALTILEPYKKTPSTLAWNIKEHKTHGVLNPGKLTVDNFEGKIEITSKQSETGDEK